MSPKAQGGGDSAHRGGRRSEVGGRRSEVGGRDVEVLPALAATSLPETDLRPPTSDLYYWVFFLAAVPVSTGFGGSSFRLYFASDVLTAAALANSAFASDSTFGASVFASV
jgi:hypothetical protein